jgi:hypothetical protein
MPEGAQLRGLRAPSSELVTYTATTTRGSWFEGHGLFRRIQPVADKPSCERSRDCAVVHQAPKLTTAPRAAPSPPARPRDFGVETASEVSEWRVKLAPAGNNQRRATRVPGSHQKPDDAKVRPAAAAGHCAEIGALVCAALALLEGVRTLLLQHPHVPPSAAASAFSLRGDAWLPRPQAAQPNLNAPGQYSDPNRMQGHRPGPPRVPSAGVDVGSTSSLTRTRSRAENSCR